MDTNLGGLVGGLEEVDIPTRLTDMTKENIDTAVLFREVSALLEQGRSIKRVLVVDEDASAVKMLSDVLQARGYSVTEASGHELAAKLAATQPDIILLSAMLSEKPDIVKMLRFEKGLENVLFLVYE